MDTPILTFDEDYKFLSNFYPSFLIYEKLSYKTVEHAFQAAKSLDPKIRLEISRALEPGYAKRLGRALKLRPDWEQVKDSIMQDLLMKKFSRDELKAKLLETGDVLLEEGNTWHDNYWGKCHCGKCDETLAKNMLGQLLMVVREMIK
jgi:ribA/ribD-fused uncharacterized protein